MAKFSKPLQIFVFPKGIVQRKEYLFKALNVDYEVKTDANDSDTLMLNRTANWGKTDFADLTSALRLEICRSENLGTNSDEENHMWLFHEINK